MSALTRLLARPAVPVTAIGLVVGVGLAGIDGAALGALIGFFLGKSLRSTARTFAARR